MEIFLCIVGVIVLVIIIAMSYQEKKIYKYEADNVVKTKFVDAAHTAIAQTRVVGTFLWGALAKKKAQEHHQTTFMVYYRNGSRDHKTVDNSSKLYHLYMSRLELDNEVQQVQAKPVEAKNEPSNQLSTTSSIKTSAPPSKDYIEKIEKLKKLYEMGAITLDEYEKTKATLLSKFANE